MLANADKPSEKIIQGAIVAYDSLQQNPKLRRESRIKSIHSSLAIEQNTLTLEQVTDVINGNYYIRGDCRYIVIWRAL